LNFRLWWVPWFGCREEVLGPYQIQAGGPLPPRPVFSPLVLKQPPVPCSLWGTPLSLLLPPIPGSYQGAHTSLLCGECLQGDPAATYASIFPIGMGMPAAETELLSQQQQQQQQQQHQVGRDPQNRNAIFAKSDLLAQETEKPASRDNLNHGYCRSCWLLGTQNGGNWGQTLPILDTSETSWTDAELAHYSTDDFRMFAFKVKEVWRRQRRSV